MKTTRSFLMFAAMAFVAPPVWAQDGEEAEQEVEIAERVVEDVAISPDSLPSAEPACFNVRTIRNFSALHDEYIYVQGRRDQHFLLTMDRACFGLRNAEGIGISNAVSRVCSNSLAEVTYRGIGNALDTCWIRAVEAVEDRTAAAALVEIRTRRDQ